MNGPEHPRTEEALSENHLVYCNVTCTCPCCCLLMHMIFSAALGNKYVLYSFVYLNTISVLLLALKREIYIVLIENRKEERQAPLS